MSSLERCCLIACELSINRGGAGATLPQATAGHLIRDGFAPIATKWVEHQDNDRCESSSFQQVKHQTFKQEQ
jgi:hypothetical protein